MVDKVKKNITVQNNEIRQNFIDKLENKLPNEFKGNIKNFNPYSSSGELHIDTNTYKY